MRRVDFKQSQSVLCGRRCQGYFSLHLQQRSHRVDIVEKGFGNQKDDAMKFFEREYMLNHYLGSYSKPIISVLNGITMGGGVGLSVHTPFRIITENTTFAMPETKIGFFPDVGGSFFLSRLSGQLGTYLGLTGARLQGKDVLMAGIGTHYIPSDRLNGMFNKLDEIDTNSYEIVNQFLEDHIADPPSKQDWKAWTLGGKTEEMINRCFKYDTMEEIIVALRKDAESSEVAKKALSLLKDASPTACKVRLPYHYVNFS